MTAVVADTRIRLTGVHAAEFVGFAQLQGPPSWGPSCQAQLRELLFKYAVLVLRDVGEPLGVLLDVVRSFGRADPFHSPEFAVPGRPEVGVLSNKLHDDGKSVGFRDAGLYWHTDGSYGEFPPLVSALYCLEAPNEGGRTCFADARAAYAELDAATRTQLESLTGCYHYWEMYEKSVKTRHLNPLSAEDKAAYPEVVRHPLVRTHPATRCKALYLNEAYLHHIDGMPEAESRKLLNELYTRVQAPRYRYAHVWQKGDLVLWDNAGVLHKAEAVSEGSIKTLYRVSGAAQAPF